MNILTRIRNRKRGDAGSNAAIGCLIYFLFVAILIMPVSCWTNSNMDFWFSQLKERPVDVPFGLSMVITIFGPATIGINIIASVARYACDYDYRYVMPPSRD